MSRPGRGRTPASLDTTKAKLISIAHENNLGVRTGVVEIPSGDWAFANCAATPFPGTPSSTQIVWDGADPNIGGAMGQFNIRFAQPGNIANIFEPGAEGPQWWTDYNDRARGRGVTGILQRCRASHTCPKIGTTITITTTEMTTTIATRTDAG